MDTFGGRLQSAMLAKGITTADQLARFTGIKPQIARKWLNMREARVSAMDLAIVSQKLQVRMIWLAIGATIPQITGTLTEADMSALTITHTLDPRELEFWLKLGHKLPTP
jgi:transcriptional regulator with XRE-family HTH domain